MILCRSLVIVAALTIGCRYEVRFETDAAPDVPAIEVGDVPSDAPVEDAPDVATDAWVRPCTVGVELMPSAAPMGPSQPTLAASDGRYALLVPPAPPATTTQLVLIDAEGGVLSMRALSIDDGSGGAATSATIHPRRDAPGFVVLSPTEARLLDALGADAGAIALMAPPLPASQREAGWVSDTELVYVASTAGQPLALVDAITRTSRVSAQRTDDATRVLVATGTVVVSPTMPALEVREHDASLGPPVFRIDWPTSSLDRRLYGIRSMPDRAWLLSDGSEFRTEVSFQQVTAAGPSRLTGMVIRGPLVTSHEGELVTIVGSDDSLTVFDLATGTFVGLGNVGMASLGLVERGATGFVTITLESTVSGSSLVFRCVGS